MSKIHYTFLKSVLLLSLLLISSCGGGGGGDDNKVATITISKYNVAPAIISKSNPQPIQFNWEVKRDDTSTTYYMDIYISQDNILDNKDTLLVHLNTNNAIQDFSLDVQTPSYEKLLNLYGGPYYIIFDAYNSDGYHSIKYFSDFILKSKWTVIIYMDGDNSLSTEVTDDLNGIEKVGSTKDVSVIVQTDTNSDTTKRYFIIPDQSTLIEDLGELNMADPNTLSDFLSWSIDKYPADHYFLILWNHGKGFKRKLPYTRDIFWDITSNNLSMSIPDMATALLTLKDKINKKVDLIGFDACLMNMLEVVYEIKDCADFVVGSENTEPINGWPYEDILRYLVENVDNVSTKDISSEIVKLYINSYNISDEATLSAIDTSQIDALKDTVNELAVKLIEGLINDTTGSLRNSLKTTIFNNVQRFDDGDSYGIDRYDDSYVDLYHLCALIKNYLPTYGEYAQNVMDVLNNLTVLSQNTGGSVSNAYSLSIWFPDPNIYSQADWLSYQQQYNALTFSKDTKWYDFITTLWGS